jgi:uncharacterized protein (TIGR02444 family)
MDEPAREEPEGDALWRFSLAFYEIPGVAQALIALQDRDGLDVNLILFALWLGLSRRSRLDSDRLAAADRAICGIRSEVVEPLRALRRRLRLHPDADVQKLRDGVKGLELAAEKLIQSRLARLAGPCDNNRSRDAGLAAAHENFALYLGPERVGVAEAAAIREALEAVAREC